MKDKMVQSARVKELYVKDKVFKKLFNLMFMDFGWAATAIDEDILKIYKIAKKYKKVRSDA